MSDEDIKNEEVTNIVNEEAPEPQPETKIEEVTEPKVKTVDVKEEAPKEPEQEFRNKTDRLKNKKVNCKDCGANLTLKTLRYSHKCSKIEDKPIRPKPKGKAKPKAVAIQQQPTYANEIIHNEVIHNEVIPQESEPAYLQQVKQQVRAPEPSPVIKSPQEIINENFKLIQQEYMNKRREKAKALTQSMFVGGLRSKRR